ncbi:DUF1854 domain-containing protein [Natronospora cellulosivora (SeqCode)]
MSTMENSMLLGEYEPIDADKLFISRDEYGDIQVSDGSSIYKQVKPLRIFPYSLKDKYILLKDRQGEEIGIVEDINFLAVKSKKILVEELERIYFIPQIIKVDKIEYKLRTASWYVETNKGFINFEMRRRSKIKFIGLNHLLIIDTNACKYEVRDFSKLDKNSQELIEREI